MSNENYSVDILVNDKPIRKYALDGKLFIESKLNTEYSIRIKNNSSGRILAVTSVDGLDSLSGKKATTDANGYVINGYNSLTVDGFRISDDKVAKFVFDYKDTSYAASKEDGSEKNVGVIGVRLFAEKIKPTPEVQEIHHHYWKKHNYGWPYYNDCGTPITPRPQNPPTICCQHTFDTVVNNINATTTDFGFFTNNSNTGQAKCGNLGSPLRAMNMMSHDTNPPSVKHLSEEKSQGFDMGTKYGAAKESKVVEVEFEKGILSFTKDIYYASRESLIQMGVPIGTEKQVSFPEPFQGNKYSTPPKGWNGNIQ